MNKFSVYNIGHGIKKCWRCNWSFLKTICSSTFPKKKVAFQKIELKIGYLMCDSEITKKGNAFNNGGYPLQ